MFDQEYNKAYRKREEGCLEIRSSLNLNPLLSNIRI